MSEATPLRAFGEADGDIADLGGRTIAFIGYGNQGRAQALNLRDSGVAGIVVGVPKDRSRDEAMEDGFEVRTVAEAAEAGDILFLLIPDEVLPEVFRDEIAAHVKAGDTLVFASGYNLMFEGVTPPDGVDVVMLAPRMIGRQARELFTKGEGFYSYISVERDASGRAWPTLLALAKGIGTLRGGAFEISAEQETLIDLYMEQGFGAIFGSLVFQALSVATEAGLPAEAMILELYLSGEMAQTLTAMAELGFVEQSRLHSLTSQYGGMTRSIRLDREPLRKHLQQALDEIKSGTFAREWAAERASGYKNFSQLRDLAGAANPFSAAEERLNAAVREAQARGKGP